MKSCFEKTRNFIRWLKQQGFKIKEITSDTFQSYDTGQMLSAEGYNYSILSVDRVETPPGEVVGICKPYQYLKNTIYEGRLKLHKSELLQTELVLLEKNNNTGKVDHPPNGSKDAADALCGATYTASKYADEYAYSYSETADINMKINKSDMDSFAEEVILNFEQELQSAKGNTNEKQQSENSWWFISDDIII